MKPTVITSGNPGDNNPQVATNPNGNNIHSQIPTGMDAHQQHQPQQQQQGFPPNGRQFPGFQHGFGFDNDVDDMFSDVGLRSRLGRMHDPFSRFDAQFGNLGTRRRANPPDDHHHHDDDDQFFGNIPTEFRQYIPDGFGFAHRRGAGGQPIPRTHPQQVPPTHAAAGHQHPPHMASPQSPKYYQTYVQSGTTPPVAVPQSPSKVVCDAAIQTDGVGVDQIDGLADNLNQHGLRNTVDMGVGSPAEEGRGSRSHSAPPQQDEANPAAGQRTQGTQRTSPPPPPRPQSPLAQRSYYPSQAQSHPQQQQQQHPPTTPGGTYIRTIPIFVEGRSEPIISQKDIPAQSKPQPQPSQSQQQQQPQPQQSRPTPLNTQQQIPVPAAGSQLPPQTPHTLESINKIQDIQRDVLQLMTSVEKFTGTRADKEYAYLDEMLTRNLLKLDTIDTNGKDSIRLARKEAIKCIQASINVLEAMAEGNANAAKTATQGEGEEEPKAAETEKREEQEEEDTSKVSNPQEPIPLPAPESLKTDESSTTPASADAAASASSALDESKPKE